MIWQFFLQPKNQTMKQTTIIIGLALLVSVIGCSENGESGGFEAASKDAGISIQDQEIEILERKLIKEGHVEFETQSIKVSRQTIFEAAEKYKGYISSDQEFNIPGRQSNTVVIRVPANNFDNLLAEATIGVEKFERKDINVKDVTEEFLDVQARLKTKKELENRFLALLKEAKNVTELLEIEKQIGQLRSEIESIEGRLKYLESRISLSTLTLSFYQTVSDQTVFGQQFKNGFKSGWENLIWFFVFLTHIWPFIFIGLGIGLGVTIYKRIK